MLSCTWDASSYIFPLKALLESFLHCLAVVVDPFLLRLPVYNLSVISWLKYIIKNVSLETPMLMGILTGRHPEWIFVKQHGTFAVLNEHLQRLYTFIQSVII